MFADPSPRAVSCSVPLVFRPYTLMAKDSLTGKPVPWNDLHKQYIDGSVDGDLPMTRLSEMFNVNHFIVSQVNPHIVPFLPKEGGPMNPAEEAHSAIPRLINTMTHLAKDEVLHRMTVLSELGVFPNSLTKFSSIMKQKYIGDINIYPELISSNFPRLLENPTTEFMLQACLGGERATWPRLSRIRNHCAIELALDSAIQQMRVRVAFSPSQIDLRIQGSLRHSADSQDSSAERGRIRARRRGSHSPELERTRRPRGQSHSRPTNGLKKARSTVSLEEPLRWHPDDPIFWPAVPKALHRRSSASMGGGIFALGSDSEDDELEISYTVRPGQPGHRATWESTAYSGPSFGNGKGPRSPVVSRRSSFSAQSSQSTTGTVHRHSPKQGHASWMRDHSVTMPQSSRHLLNMTSTILPSSPESLKRKPRQ